MTEIFHVLS